VVFIHNEVLYTIYIQCNKYTLYIRCNKTRTQQQKKQSEILKHLETEQHMAPWSLDHRGNKGGNQKVPGI
jgi:hypothetical protein